VVPATLERTTFEVSREVEYFTESELRMQIGFDADDWPVALLKELIDNALDGCEAAGTPPIIRVDVEPDAFTVEDNGPGLPEATIAGSLDYMKRVSDKLFYASPTRGRLGNALKVVWAAPYVAHGQQGYVEVWTGGQRHTVKVRFDRIAGRPVVEHETKEDALVTTGTRLRVTWPESATSLLGEGTRRSYKSAPNASELVAAFAACNPHAGFRIGEKVFRATDPAWTKWRTCDPTSAHWYAPEALRDLLAAEISSPTYQAQPKTVRAFVSEFRGLSSAVKQKSVTAEWSRAYLHDLVRGGDLDSGAVGALLARMQLASKPPKPVHLGVIGEEHVTRWMTEHAGVVPESISYAKKLGEQDGLPYVLEFGFGQSEDDNAKRRLVVGLNWSAALENPILELNQLLAKQRIDAHDPVVVFAHIAKPLLQFTDRGKARVAL